MALNIMTGYEEDIDTHTRLLEQIANGLGGRRMNDEVQERFPGAWDYWKTYGIEHEPCIHFMKGFALGYGFMHILFAEPKNVVRAGTVRARVHLEQGPPVRHHLLQPLPGPGPEHIPAPYSFRRPGRQGRA